ncbi:hypothetical protein [Psychrobacter sp. AOP7-B1-24]|uniref:hypothetical protein n=1 Tax=Psychrobacter sp. AOP7-B1-24 TaxID=3457645 RepID=UPI00402B50C7
MNTLTKFAIALPTFALLSACATTAPTTPNASDVPASDIPESETVPSAAYDRMAPAPYTCTDDSQIMVKQSINKKQVMLNVTLPKVKWAAQPIILNGDAQEHVASYVNDSSPGAVYAWHMKEDKGIFAIKWADGTEYHVSCQI